jgi:hypothetical protein
MFKKRDQQLLAEAYGQIRQPEKYTYINAIRHAQKTNNQNALSQATADLESWAHENNAMQDPEVLEYLDLPVTTVKSKYTYINAIRHAQKTNDQSALQKATADLKSWAQANNAMQDPDVVEYLY